MVTNDFQPLERLRQGNHEFEVSLGNIVKPLLLRKETIIMKLFRWLYKITKQLGSVCLLSGKVPTDGHVLIPVPIYI